MKAMQRWGLLAAVVLLLGLWVGVPRAVAFTVDVTIDSVTIDQNWIVTVEGTVTCDESTAEYVDVYVEVNQPIGRKDSVLGCGYVEFSPVTNCDDPGLDYSFQILPGSCEGIGGRFGPGLAYVTVGANGCNSGYADCDDDQETTVVRLKREHKEH